MFCSRTPEMDELHRHAFSPYISSGYADQQNSQPVNLRFLTNTESEMYQSCLEKIATLEARQRSERAREEATV